MEYAPVAVEVLGECPSTVTEHVAVPPPAPTVMMRLPPLKMPDAVSVRFHGSETSCWLVEVLPLFQVVYTTVTLFAEPVTL